MSSDLQSHTVIKLARKVFQYDVVLGTYGWTHDVFFDINSKTYIIVDFPEKGRTFDAAELPIGDEAEITVQNKIYKVRIYE